MEDGTQVRSSAKNSNASFRVYGNGFEVDLEPGQLCSVGNALGHHITIPESGVSSTHLLIFVQRHPSIRLGVPKVYDISKYGTFVIGQNGQPLLNGVAIRDSKQTERIKASEVKKGIKSGVIGNGEDLKYDVMNLLTGQNSPFDMEYRFADAACIQCSKRFVSSNPGQYQNAFTIPNAAKLALESCPDGHGAVKELETVVNPKTKDNYFLLTNMQGSPKFPREYVAKYSLEPLLMEGTAYTPKKEATLRLIDPTSPKLELKIKAIRF